MKIIKLNKDGKKDITNLVTSVTLSGDYRSCSRTLDFGIINSLTDLNIQMVSLELGDNVQLFEEDTLLFHGVIWEKSRTSDSNEINLMARDFGIYLNKNKASHNYSKLTPEEITKGICKDFGINAGDIASTGARISRKFMGATLYEIIMTAYTLANDKKYICFFKGDKLNVAEKAILKSKDIDSSNLLTANVSESLNDMVNRVNIYNKNDAFVKKIENTSDIASYGLMADYYKANDNNYSTKAKKMLQGVSRKITVTNFGDISYISGNAVEYTEPFNGTRALFYIDTDEHNWKNGIYTNKLTLNFENLMDEKEGGSNE